MNKETIFHCDMYYHECSKRGKVDEFDLRKDKKGFILPKRCICSDGIYPSDIPKPCPHCIEYKHLYRRTPRQKASRVRTYKVYDLPCDGLSVDGTR